MAVKTITIDIEAYDVLSRHKRPGQSFSQVIKEQLGGRQTVGAFKRVVRATAVAERTLDSIDAQLASRRKWTARVPEL
jgi:predicted CopG family antitoxin